MARLPAAEDAAARGLAAFAFGDFGAISTRTLETNALPYKVVAVALLAEREARTGAAATRDDLAAEFRRYGFMTTDRLANWPEQPPAPAGRDRPVGLVSGTVGGGIPPLVRTDAVNVGCAACHAGVTYDASGEPTGQVWLGLPNTSVNIEAFTRVVYERLKRLAAEPDTLVRRAEALFPEMGWRERFTLRHFVVPRVRDRITELAATIDAPQGYSNGGPGMTNGVAALKDRLGLLAPDRHHAEYGFASIPDLASRHLRSSLLYDGVYAPSGAEHFRPLDADSAVPPVEPMAGVVGFFTVSTMGLRPEDVPDQLETAGDVMRWLTRRYSPPPFPGPIDADSAARGAELFEVHCAECHGRYEEEGPPPRRLTWYPNRLVPQDEIATDSMRWSAVDSTFIAALSRTAYRDYVSTRRTGGYVAPILSGLWATAPYLHNGSVPTLWQLMNPAERPTRFMVGGHRLDYRDVGIDGAPDAEGVYRYPADYEPWSEPALYDTRRPGLDNRGHEAPFDELTTPEKRALLEYLKTL
ncbi:MAG: hypothetical protein ACODAE_06780 [Gemmatimonadota bacterium]